VFSGIIARMGILEESRREAQGQRLVIRADLGRAPDPGESVAVNGVCLTVERADAARFEAVAVEETLRRTTLGGLSPGARVHLEPALRAGDPIGGHWVQGHVDGVGIVRKVAHAGSDVRLAVEIPEALRKFVAVKGSLAVDGVSLTVADWEEPCAILALVPYTLAHTTASDYAPGHRVNVEVDILSRYLERLLEAREARLAGVTSGSAPEGRR